MGTQLKSLTLEGFKSIRTLENFELRRLNLLIGANGAGKSNLVGFFSFLRNLVAQNLNVTTGTMGGADSILFLGRKATPSLHATMQFGGNGYSFRLLPTDDGRFIFADESVAFNDYWQSLGAGHAEARLANVKDEPGNWGAPRGVPHYVFEAVASWTVYHFHDTSPSAAVRLPGSLNDNRVFRPHAENLAAYLYLLAQRYPVAYSKIRDVVRQATPFFHDFHLRPDPLNPEMIQLEWRQEGADYPFRASQLSDGTLRFICLATALLQPAPPATVLFDEPELGLHPAALTLLAGLFKSLAGRYGQILASTQSAPLLSEFSPEDVIVAERNDGASQFRRLDAGPLEKWLREYALGDLWQMNLIGGRPGDRLAPVVMNGQVEPNAG